MVDRAVSRGKRHTGQGVTTSLPYLPSTYPSGSWELLLAHAKHPRLEFTRHELSGVKVEFKDPEGGVQNGNTAVADISAFLGQNGHNIYLNLHQNVVNSWRHESKYECDVDSNF